MEVNHSVKTIIVGFGFSCVPLLRELDRTGEEYLVISDKIPNRIWVHLKRNGRLDFDLVSSYNTSFYSHEQVERFKTDGRATDGFPTAKEFYDVHLSYLEHYKEKIVGDQVVKVDNHDGYSIVHTESGVIYRAENVVFTTGYRRNIHDALNTFDYGVSGKTIVFNTLGDSANLMIAKLVAQNNKIICLSNGFNALDKMFEINQKTVTLDQIEYHNVGFLFPRIYRAMISGNSIFPLVMMAMSFGHTRLGRFFSRLFLGIGKIITPNLFAFAYPKTIRALKFKFSKLLKAMPVPNGIIAIKYWPIDAYSKMFGANLEESIKNGYLLNDLPLFIDQGLVEHWNKSEVSFDHDSKTITNTATGTELTYDYFVDGGPENPRLPPMVIKCVVDGHETEEPYKYVYRENYLGIVPKKLSNVFFIGHTRPTTGGVANMTEMQGLLTHKMIFNTAFRNDVYRSIDRRIDEYCTKYYATDGITPTDHLVFYGFYTEEVARAIGINIKLSDCKSLQDVSKFIFFPNNTFKYRQSGEYRVEGCKELVSHIDKTHQSWLGLKMRLFTFGMYHAIIFATLLLSYKTGAIGLPVLIGLLVLQYVLNFAVITPTVYSQLFVASVPYCYLRFSYLVLGLVAILINGPAWFFPIIGGDFLLSYLVRTFKPESARLTFNDLKIKRSYRPFLQKYLETYRAVCLENTK